MGFCPRLTRGALIGTANLPGLLADNSIEDLDRLARNQYAKG
jgi:hypothetical protein